MDDAVPDKLAVRFEDGPLAAVPQVFLPEKVYGWPLPERLAVLAHLEHASNVALWDADDPGSSDLPDVITESPNAVVYEKVGESALPSNLPNVMRGAVYRLEAKRDA